MDNPAVPIPSAPLQPAVEQPAVPPAETSSPRWLLWLLGGLAVLALGIAVGLFSAKFFSQSQSSSPLASTPSSAQSPTPTPTPDLYREPTGSAATAN